MLICESVNQSMHASFHAWERSKISRSGDKSEENGVAYVEMSVACILKILLTCTTTIDCKKFNKRLVFLSISSRCKNIHSHEFVSQQLCTGMNFLQEMQKCCDTIRQWFVRTGLEMDLFKIA